MPFLRLPYHLGNKSCSLLKPISWKLYIIDGQLISLIEMITKSYSLEMDRSLFQFSYFFIMIKSSSPNIETITNFFLRRTLNKSYQLTKVRIVKQFFVSRNKKKKFYQTLFPKIQSLSIHAQTTGSLSSFICIVFVVLSPCPFLT